MKEKVRFWAWMSMPKRLPLPFAEADGEVRSWERLPTARSRFAAGEEVGTCGAPECLLRSGPTGYVSLLAVGRNGVACELNRASRSLRRCRLHSIACLHRRQRRRDHLARNAPVSANCQKHIACSGSFVAGMSGASQVPTSHQLANRWAAAVGIVPRADAPRHPASQCNRQCLLAWNIHAQKSYLSFMTGSSPLWPAEL